MQTVDKSFFEHSPSYTMFLLVEMKNSGMSWRQIGDRLGVSSMLVWKVAKGRCKSNAIDAALGIEEKLIEVPETQAKKNYPNPRDRGRHRRAAEFTEDRAALYDAMLVSFDMTTTEVLNSILDAWILVN